ncbi:MAG: folylpolyglutamate synthase/dihydrofolate synthase family protein [Phycisphaerales bacterium]|nr:folylpolyglutamate synthase/dihydrofolate synthase family protein [Phycisphaerales bacterium]
MIAHAGAGGVSSAPARGLAEAMEWLTGRPNFERKSLTKADADAFKLDRMRALAARLDDPQKHLRFAHVAGSKGKGSVVEMLAAALAGCGYATGTFTSPHLVDLRERIRIGREMIPNEALTQQTLRVADAAAKIRRAHGEVTFFEAMTAIALCHFAEQAVDIAVMEVGLGGRLDCTNIVTPEVCGLTEIQLEHAEVLGGTLEKIAGEKAGIMKPGVPAITFKQKPEVMDTFRAAAAEIGAPLLVLGEDVDFSWRFESSPELGPHARVSLLSPRGAYEHIAVPLRGEHQALNCGVALAMLDVLRQRGFSTPEVGVARGLASTPGNGRLEQVWTQPRVFIDGAHNPESIRALVRSLGAHVRYDSLVVIFGCARDKDIDGMLRELALGADKVIFTRSSSSPRAADPRELQRRFIEQSQKMTQVAGSLPEAVDLAARAVARDDVLLVAGSFYLAGEAKKHLAERSASRVTSGRAPRVPEAVRAPRPSAHRV